MPEIVGIVLCGGASRRMGRSKADLPLGPETLLERAVRRLAAAVDLVVVAAAPGQPLPALDPRRVRVVRDSSPHLGPLRGLETALAVLPETAEFAYLAAVDAPWFSAEWLRLLVDGVGDRDAASAAIDGRLQPFAALYRVGPTRAAVARLLAEGDRRLSALLERLDVRPVPAADLAAVDPGGDPFRDLDRPEDYRRALDEMAAE